LHSLGRLTDVLKLDGIELKDVCQKIENNDSLFHIPRRSIIYFLQKGEKLMILLIYQFTKNAVLLKKIDLKSHEIKVRQIKNTVEFIIFYPSENLKKITDRRKINFIIDLNFRAGNGISINSIFKNTVIIAHENLKIGDNFTIHKLIEEKINNIDRFILYKFL
jgi:hypothetical protein